MPALDTSLKAGEAVLIGCPYCGKIIGKVSLEGILEATCSRCEKRGEWHHGVFLATSFNLSDKKVRAPEKNLPGRYQLKGQKGDATFEVSFFSMEKIDIRKGDLISISYSKSPRSVLNLTWAGSYKNKPSLLIIDRTRKVHRI
ncbi:hypothetical protein FJY84_01995 [Candidatus Bathyarchaeota archaeon]|nr:hypothetical protein [Candidatus Bathyarchaeota archaeon]